MRIAQIDELNAYGEQLVYMPDHGTKSYEGKDDIIDAIQSAIVNGRLVRYRYGGGRGHARSGYLAPFRLAMYRHGLYAIGARLKAATDAVDTAPLGVFAIERFDEVEYLRGRAFQIPSDTNLRDVLTGPSVRTCQIALNRTALSSNSAPRRRI
jgi:hypothetical protein